MLTPRRTVPAFDWWTADSFTRVFQDDIPGDSREGHLEMARNERQSFQICIRPTGKPLKNVNIGLSDLVSAKWRISSGNIQWNRVGYVWVHTPNPQYPIAERKSPSWWPDPLLAPTKFSIDDAETQPLWFTVYVPQNAPAGVYEGYVTISADGIDHPVRVPVSVRVYPVVVPTQGYMKTAFALIDEGMNRIYGKVDKPLRRAYTDYLLAHHINPDNIYRDADPDYDELEYANGRGMNAFTALSVLPEATNPKVLPWADSKTLSTPEFRKNSWRGSIEL